MQTYTPDASGVLGGPNATAVDVPTFGPSSPTGGPATTLPPAATVDQGVSIYTVNQPVLIADWAPAGTVPAAPQPAPGNCGGCGCGGSCGGGSGGPPIQAPPSTPQTLPAPGASGPAASTSPAPAPSVLQASTMTSELPWWLWLVLGGLAITAAAD